MKSLITICAVMAVTFCFSAPSWAAYTIDGDLTDWGVTPFTDWVPDSATADFWETDNINEYSANGYEEGYDFEASYFDDDLDNLYFAVVTSYKIPWRTYAQFVIGDLGIDLNDDFSVTTHGVVSGLEYAVRVSSADPGEALFTGTASGLAKECRVRHCKQLMAPWLAQQASLTRLTISAVMKMILMSLR